MEELKDVLQKAKNELDRSDDVSCYSGAVSSDLHHLREAVRHLITYMEQEDTKHWKKGML